MVKALNKVDSFYTASVTFKQIEIILSLNATFHLIEAASIHDIKACVLPKDGKMKLAGYVGGCPTTNYSSHPFNNLFARWNPCAVFHFAT